MIPSVGRIVHYKLGKGEADQINKRRQDARLSQVAQGESGVVVHTGNTARAGDTRVWSDDPTENTSVNGQVFLDGNDSLWATSRQQGAHDTQWSDPRG
jgi:hypothetical protein